MEAEMNYLIMSEKTVAQYWNDYYREKGETVIAATTNKRGIKDNRGFQKYIVTINVKPHHMYNFEYYAR